MSRKSGWRSLWRFALLAASILSSCCLLTEGQLTTLQVVLQPPSPAEGQEVTLTPGDVVKKAILCRWYRGLTTEQTKLIFFYVFPPKPEQTNGPASTGRETAGRDCSLHIMDLTSEDAGNYTVAVDGPGISAIGSASIVIGYDSITASCYSDCFMHPELLTPAEPPD